MPFFRRPLDEAEKHHRSALRLRDHKKKEFNLGQSVWHLKQAIQLKPNNPVFHYQLGRTYVDAPMLAVIRDINVGFRLRDSAELALAEIKEAIRLKPDYPEAYMVLGEVYMYLGENEKALQALRAARGLSSGQIFNSYIEQKSQQAEQGISMHPQPSEAKRHLEEAVINRSLGKYRQAEKELEKALRLAPDWHWMYDNLCRVG